MTDPTTPAPQGEPTPPPPGATTPPPAGGPASPPPSGYTAPPPGYGQQPPAYAQQPQGYGQPGATPAGAPLTPEQDKQWAMWAHLGGILFLLPSLIIWLVFKDRGPRVNTEGKEALNWQITFTIIYVGAAIVFSILSFAVWFLGFLTGLVLFAIWVVNIIFSVQGGMKVNAGGSYRYPINFRFIK